MVDVSRRAEPGAERTYTISMQTDLYAAAQDLAAENDRSLHMQLRRYLREGAQRDEAHTSLDVAARTYTGVMRTSTVSFPVELYDLIQKLAADNDRSMNEQLRRYIREGVALDLARQSRSKALAVA